MRKTIDCSDDKALVIEDESLEVLIIESTVMVQSLIIRECSIGSMEIRSARIKDGLEINNCEIGSVDIRLPKSRVPQRALLANSRFGGVLMRGCWGVSLHRVRVQRDITLQNSHDVDVFDVRCDDLVLDMMEQAGDVSICVADVRSAGSVVVRGYSARDLDLSGVHSRWLSFERCDYEKATVRGGDISQAVRVNVPDSLDGMLKFESCSLGDLAAHKHDPRSIEQDSPNHQGRLCFVDSHARGDATIRGQWTLDLERSRISGVVDASPLAGLKVQLDGGSSVAKLELPSERVLSVRDARTLFGRVFPSGSPGGYDTLLRSLDGRGREADFVYFAKRSTEPRGATGSTVWRWIAGRVFGWGVLPSRPALALIVLLAISCIGTYAFSPPCVSARDALLLTSGFWLAYGTWQPQWLNSPLWSAYAVSLAALGLLFTTVLVGIAVRRLVR